MSNEQALEPDEYAWDQVNAECDANDDTRPEQFMEEDELEGDWVNFTNRLVLNPEYVEWMNWRIRRARQIMQERQHHD